MRDIVIFHGRKPTICKPIDDDLFGVGKGLLAIDLWLVLVFNFRSERYEIHDSNPKVHPRHTLLMRIQNEDGSYRLPDSRDLAAMRKMVQRSQNPEMVYNELEEAEEARERQWKQGADATQWLLMQDLKWAGKDVTPSTIWRDRSQAPVFKTSPKWEAIRKEAYG